MAKGFLGNDGKAAYIDKVYVGVNNKARLCKTGYVGVNGIARRILPFPISPPQVEGTYTYNGKAQTVKLSEYDPSIIEVTGDLTATNAGAYSITARLIDRRYTWKDGTQNDIRIYWRISKKILDTVKILKRPQWTGWEPNTRLLELDYDASALNVEVTTINDWKGKIKATVKDPVNYGILRESKSSDEFTWNVEKAKLKEIRPAEGTEFTLTWPNGVYINLYAYNEDGAGIDLNQVLVHWQETPPSGTSRLKIDGSNTEVYIEPERLGETRFFVDIRPTGTGSFLGGQYKAHYNVNIISDPSNE